MTADIASRVKKLIADHLGGNDLELKPDASLIDDLGADSLDAVELLMAAEEEFNCEISDEEAEKVMTVQDAIDMVRRKTGLE